MLAPGLDPSSLGVSVTWPGTTASGSTCDTTYGANSPNCQVKVEVTYQLSLPIPLIANHPVKLRSDSEMSIVQ
jgi:hypothetical protein